MLSGNLIAILSSGLIHVVYSLFVDPHDYDFDELDKHITLVEDDNRGLTEADKDPHALAKAERWITRRGYVLTLRLILVWPLLSVPAGVFTRSYFAFWVLVAIAWGFGAAIIITVLPLTESSEDINTVLSGIYNKITGRGAVRAEEPASYSEPKKVVEPAVEAEKDPEPENFMSEEVEA